MKDSFFALFPSAAPAPIPKKVLQEAVAKEIRRRELNQGLAQFSVPFNQAARKR